MFMLTAMLAANVLTHILEVFSSVGDWIVTAVTKLEPLFWSSESGLTFVGVLCVAGLAFSVAFLLINLIKGWMRFGG